MKISHRDVFADLPKNLLKKKMEELSKKHNVKNVQGYQATLDAIPQLADMFHNEEIESMPWHITLGTVKYVKWKDKDGEEHRENNLPSADYKDGDKEYKVHGGNHRTNGPSREFLTENRIVWLKDDNKIAEHHVDSFYDVDNTRISRDEYEDLVRKEFPEAGNKIFLEDYM